jgi:hypothetical protein
LDRRHAPQQLELVDRRIIVIQPVAARNQARSFAFTDAANNAVDKQPVVPRKKDDLSAGNIA